MREYYVYILSSLNRTLYVGVTNNLERRLYEHKHKLIQGFTARYNVNRLVYMEKTSDVNVALNREKEIKAWRREKKIALIESLNPEWNDLMEWRKSVISNEREKSGKNNEERK